MFALLIFTINTMTYVKSLPGEKEGSQGKTCMLFCPLTANQTPRKRELKNTVDFQSERFRHMGPSLYPFSISEKECDKA
jgi:hypothetical protein